MTRSEARNEGLKLGAELWNAGEFKSLSETDELFELDAKGGLVSGKARLTDKAIELGVPEKHRYVFFASVSRGLDTAAGESR